VSSSGYLLKVEGQAGCGAVLKKLQYGKVQKQQYDRLAISGTPSTEGIEVL